MNKTTLAALALGTAIGMAPAANADVLDFAGLNGQSYEEVLNYYAGGFGSLGLGPGPNYGITFSSNAIVGAPSPYTNSNDIPPQPNGQLLFFLTGTGDIMNSSTGFSTGFSFEYSAPYYTGSVTVYDGLNGTGSVLASLFLPTTTSGGGTCSTTYCPYFADGIGFSGVAHSVVWSGTADYIAFAEITTNSVTPGGTPEPSTWAMMLLGFAGLGFAGYRASRKNAAFAA